MRLSCFLALMLAGACAARSQAVSFGVVGGVPISDTEATHNEARPYIVGPSFEFRLPAHFAVEVDALYRRVGNSNGFISVIGSDSGLVSLQGSTVLSFSRDRGNSWEFPMLGKYYFHSGSEHWQPFVGLGAALRATWFHNDSSATIPGGTAVTQFVNQRLSYTDGVGAGAVAAAGMRFRMGRVAFAPQVRYTRWASANFQRNARNEGGIMLGISF